MDHIPPGIDAKSLGEIVLAEDFPLSPVEAWMIMRGYWVKPKQVITVDKFLKLPGHLEMSDGYIGLRK